MNMYYVTNIDDVEFKNDLCLIALLQVKKDTKLLSNRESRILRNLLSKHSALFKEKQGVVTQFLENEKFLVDLNLKEIRYTPEFLPYEERISSDKKLELKEKGEQAIFNGTFKSETMEYSKDNKVKNATIWATVVGFIALVFGLIKCS